MYDIGVEVKVFRNPYFKHLNVNYLNLLFLEKMV